VKRDSRLSDVLHLLLHLAGSDRPVTSDSLARMLRTNPVVVRRILSGLRTKGLVTSEKGHGGGWRLARDLDAITLYDVFAALGSPTILAMENRNESPGCLVEAAVNSATEQAFLDAEAVLLARFREVTLAALRDDAYRRAQAHPLHHGQPTALLGECPRESQEQKRV
jgi:Rrf2 family protein